MTLKYKVEYLRQYVTVGEKTKTKVNNTQIPADNIVLWTHLANAMREWQVSADGRTDSVVEHTDRCVVRHADSSGLPVG